MSNTKEQTLPGKSFFFIAALPPFSMRIFNYWHTNLIVFTRKRKTSKKMDLSFSFSIAYFIDMVIIVSYFSKLTFIFAWSVSDQPSICLYTFLYGLFSYTFFTILSIWLSFFIFIPFPLFSPLFCLGAQMYFLPRGRRRSSWKSIPLTRAIKTVSVRYSILSRGDWAFSRGHPPSNNSFLQVRIKSKESKFFSACVSVSESVSGWIRTGLAPTWFT